MSKRVVLENKSDINNLEKYCPGISQTEQESFLKYYEILKNFNSTINLVSRGSIESAANTHFADCYLSMKIVFQDIPQGENGF